MNNVQKIKDFFKYNPETGNFDNAQIFENCITDLQLWTGINDLTVNDLACYFWERYANMMIWKYPTTFIFSQVSIWHNTRKYYFDGLYETTQAEYNPLYNVDEFTSETNERTPQLSHTKTGTETNADSRTSTNTTNVTGTNQVTTYDSNAFNDDSKSTQNATTNTTNGGNIQTTYNTTEAETGKDTNELTRRRYGNIGITSSQQLIEQERKIRDLSIFDLWCERFAERFFIPIYDFEGSF